MIQFSKNNRWLRRSCERERVDFGVTTAVLLGLFLLTSLRVGAADAWDFKPDPALPNVLILGDSISIGYTRAVRAQLAGRANVFRPLNPARTGAENCRDTVYGLTKIDSWISGTRWDVIHFNWGLWDLCYRNPAVNNQGNRDKVGGKIAVPIEAYSRHLEQLVAKLAATGATLVWANTTVVPDDELGRFKGDERRYNDAAAVVMARRGIAIDDLHAASAAFTPAMFRARGDVHPTDAGYDKLATVVAYAVTEALAGRKP
ncbi:MAG: SGNH/GDSL hydrolase family protein [Opitutus sp.]|nr:SGNH/GDSL hydrolase family protein [Opitutus sp.]